MHKRGFSSLESRRVRNSFMVEPIRADFLLLRSHIPQQSQETKPHKHPFRKSKNKHVDNLVTHSHFSPCFFLSNRRKLFFCKHLDKVKTQLVDPVIFCFLLVDSFSGLWQRSEVHCWPLCHSRAKCEKVRGREGFDLMSDSALRKFTKTWLHHHLSPFFCPILKQPFSTLVSWPQWGGH